MTAKKELFDYMGHHMQPVDYVKQNMIVGSVDGVVGLVDKIIAALSEAHAQGFEDCRCGLSELDDDELAEHGLMRVPLDANGTPLHLGDKVHDCEDGHDFVIDGFKIWGDSTEWWAYQDDAVQYPLDRCALIKQPSVKDLLYEMYDRLDEPSGDDQNKHAEEIIAEYVDRLQLRCDD